MPGNITIKMTNDPANKYFSLLNNGKLDSNNGYFYFYQDVLAGEACCMDISGLHSGWKSSKPGWSKKCCNKSNNQAVIPPSSDVSEKDIKTINEQIGKMSGMKLVRFSNRI